MCILYSIFICVCVVYVYVCALHVLITRFEHFFVELPLECVGSNFFFFFFCKGVHEIDMPISLPTDQCEAIKIPNWSNVGVEICIRFVAVQSAGSAL